MVNSVMGLMLVDAPFSALNNQGTDSGVQTENIVRTKVVRRGRNVYPYVSGQAVRYWWRTTLATEKNWSLSPIEREKKIAFTAADPVTYPDDDVFGYMKAPAKTKETLTRISPLKVSPLISILPMRPVEDFGVMARHEGNPVPYEHEFYSSVLKGIFSVDIDNLGRFYQEQRSGRQNLGSEVPDSMRDQLTKIDDGSWQLNKDTRKTRLFDVLSVLPYLSGGAKLSTHLTSVSPSFLILGTFNMGNHVLLHAVGESDGNTTFNKAAMDQILVDYEDRLLTKLYIGKQNGFLDEWNQNLAELATNEHIVYSSVKQSVDNFIKELGTKNSLF